MQGKFPHLFCLFIVFISTSVFTLAQEHSISGVVYTQESEPESVSRAYILLKDKAGKLPNKTAVSDENGRYRVDEIKAGDYILKIQSLGFEPVQVPISFSSGGHIEKDIYLTSKVYQAEMTVVTASRTLKDIEDVSVPITVVKRRDIEMSGSTRLGDVLASQTGLNVVSNHGTGVQIQGFDPEYTLILIDNQPVIGRTAGTLDLDRISVGDIHQIEIVKGPSSALWGSDALAGVINIITKKKNDPFTWDVSGRYGSNTSYDGSTNLSFKQNKLSGRFFGNINGSQGFDLNPDNISPTVPEHQSYTFSGGLDYALHPNIKLRMQSRYYREDLNFLSDVAIDNDKLRIQADEFQENYRVAPQINFHIGSKQLFEATYYYSRHKSGNRMDFYETGGIYNQTNFDQQLNKYELKSSTFWDSNHTTVLGIGANHEELLSQRYVGAPTFNSFFTFGQHEWLLSDEFSLTAGFRFDAHSEYDSQLSPKLSGLYKPNKFVHVRASFGGGFKAPGFSELFLNFTNAQVGYSVFGASTVVDGIEQLQNEGRIKELLIDPETIGDIKAEHSFAFNAGVDLFPNEDVQVRLNIFRNNVRDLLETQRIATKNNGQSVFSYFNLNKIYTQGFETELRFEPADWKNLSLTLGYQFLDAKREITRPFDDVVDGKVVSKPKKEYIPLFNRSKHSWNIRFFYEIESIGLENSLRVQYRDEYWFADQKFNYRIDDNELSNPYLIMDYSLAKNITSQIRLQIGINNFTNYRDAQFLPSNPGITFYTQLNIQLY